MRSTDTWPPGTQARLGASSAAGQPTEIDIKAVENAIGALRRDMASVAIKHMIALERSAGALVAKQLDGIDVADIRNAFGGRLESIDGYGARALHVCAGPYAPVAALPVPVTEHDATEAGFVERGHRPNKKNPNPR